MNRSFQSIAALLISLSGAMLAVMWTPAEGPRRPTAGASARRRAVTLPCGFVATRPLMATRHLSARPLTSLGSQTAAVDATEADSVPSPDGLVPLPMDAQSLASRGSDLAAWSRTMADAPAAKAIAAAFGQALRPLWPVEKGTAVLADQSLRDEERRRIEADYAAAELTAGGGARPRLAGAIEWATHRVNDAVAAVQSANWSSLSQQIGDELYCKYDELITELGWQDTLRPLAAHVRRQHERLVLREALLKEMDRRFLESPVTRPEAPLLHRPKFRTPSRRLVLAAADALKSLSRTLDSAAEQLEAASRQDVAELHNPLQNSEEKR